MRKIEEGYGLTEFPTKPLKPGLKLRTIGTKCNLGCFMCRAYDSSTRRMELSQANLWDMWRDLGIKEYEKDKNTNTITDRYLVKLGKFSQFI